MAASAGVAITTGSASCVLGKDVGAVFLASSASHAMGMDSEFVFATSAAPCAIGTDNRTIAAMKRMPVIGGAGMLDKQMKLWRCSDLKQMATDDDYGDNGDYNF